MPDRLKFGLTSMNAGATTHQIAINDTLTQYASLRQVLITGSLLVVQFPSPSPP